MEPLIALPPDSPASPPPLRASAEVRLILAGSGGKSCALFRSTNPIGVCLRMLLASSVWDSTPYSATWMLRATKRGRLYFRLRLSAPRISGSASSLWATPQASDGLGGRTISAGTSPTGRRPDGRKTTVGLNNQVKMLWPTPTVTGGNNRKGLSAKSGDGLATAAKLWPTPQSRDYRSGDNPNGPRARRKQAQGWSPNLNDVALWSTPAAQDGKNATCPASPATRDTLPGDLLRSGAMGSLNPEWVEVLMGLPEGWTAVDDQPSKKGKR